MTATAYLCSRCHGFMSFNAVDKDWSCLNCGNVWSKMPPPPMEERENLTVFWEETRSKSKALDAYRRVRTQQAKRRQKRALALSAAGLDFDSLQVRMNLSKRTLQRYLGKKP